MIIICHLRGITWYNLIFRQALIYAVQKKPKVITMYIDVGRCLDCVRHPNMIRFSCVARK